MVGEVRRIALRQHAVRNVVELREQKKAEAEQKAAEEQKKAEEQAKAEAEKKAAEEQKAAEKKLADEKKQGKVSDKDVFAKAVKGNEGLKGVKYSRTVSHDGDSYTFQGTKDGATYTIQVTVDGDNVSVTSASAVDAPVQAPEDSATADTAQAE